MSKPVIPPLCVLCEHYDETQGNCRAFPEGIPDRIWNSELDHRQPIGDEAITFEMASGVEESQVRAWEKARVQYVAAIESDDMGLPPLEDEESV